MDGCSGSFAFVALYSGGEHLYASMTPDGPTGTALEPNIAPDSDNDDRMVKHPPSDLTVFG